MDDIENNHPEAYYIWRTCRNFESIFIYIIKFALRERVTSLDNAINYPFYPSVALKRKWKILVTHYVTNDHGRLHKSTEGNIWTTFARAIVILFPRENQSSLIDPCSHPSNDVRIKRFILVKNQNLSFNMDRSRNDVECFHTLMFDYCCLTTSIDDRSERNVILCWGPENQNKNLHHYFAYH